MARNTSLEQQCRECGLRIRVNGGAVLKVLDNSSDHPSAEDIYRRAVVVDPEINLSTVYRMLKDLVAANLIVRIDLGDGKQRYEHARNSNHDHIIDNKSGAIVEFNSPMVEVAIREAVAELGYDLTAYRLNVYGSTREPNLSVKSAGRIHLVK